MMTEEQLTKAVHADTVAMVKNVSRVDQACSLLRSRFEVWRGSSLPCVPAARTVDWCQDCRVQKLPGPLLHEAAVSISP